MTVNKNNESIDQKIIKPKAKQSCHSINKIKLKQIKNKKYDSLLNYTSNKIISKIKINKFYSGNDKEKHKEKKKASVIKLLKTKHLFKEKEEPKIKYRNSMSKHNLKMPHYNNINFKKNSVESSNTMNKDMKMMMKPNSHLSLKFARDHFLTIKKSNKNLTHKELDKSFTKKNTYGKNFNIPKIAINTKSQENNAKDVHLVVKGREETIKNYTNTQMIKEENDYMIDCLKILAKIKIEEMPRCKQKVNFNFPPEEKQKKIALFDLDETLVHCTNNNEPGIDGDIVSIKLPTNKIVKVGLNIRKNWQKALDLIKNHYHIVIYTASHPSYADAVLDYMDKEKKYFKYRLYRSHCIQCDIDGFKFYVKDLDTLDKYYNLKDIVIIDNSILSFAYHLYNGIPIVPFINQPDDTELIFTAHYLISIANYDDLSLENKKHLNLDNLLLMAQKLNDIEDNEEGEEEDFDDTKGDSFNLIDMNKDNKDKENKNDNNINNEINIEKNKNEMIKEQNEEKKDIEGKEEKKDKFLNVIKQRGKLHSKKSKKTMKIAEDMKKNIDEMMKKKKEELEKIEED